MSTNFKDHLLAQFLNFVVYGKTYKIDPNNLKNSFKNNNQNNYNYIYIYNKYSKTPAV
jgi:hypothetical protein